MLFSNLYTRYISHSICTVLACPRQRVYKGLNNKIQSYIVGYEKSDVLLWVLGSAMALWLECDGKSLYLKQTIASI